MRHYYRGNGRGVTVRETGHLSATVDEYMAQVEKRPKDQIATEARSKRTGSFTYPFGRPYKMKGSLDFYLGDKFADPADLGVEVIDPGETIFENIHRPLNNYLRGRTGLPPRGPQGPRLQTGEPYSITDDWSGTLRGQIYLDPARSAYG